jgi:DNA modification methylase
MTDDKKGFNGLTPTQWASKSSPVLRGFSSERNNLQRKHGATFPRSLIEHLISIYSAENDLIFDPFAGTGTTIMASKVMKRRGIGIELNKDFFKGSNSDVKMSLDFHANPELANQNWRVINDDCRNMESHVEKESVQAVITSPPYANFIQKSLDSRPSNSMLIENNSLVKQYSENPLDLGNCEYATFLDELEKILVKCFVLTKRGGYGIWIVKDTRNTKNNVPYINMHSDVIEAGEQAGFKLHDLLVWDQSEHRKNVILGFPSIFYMNQNFSFVIVFRKWLHATRPVPDL